MDDGCCKETCRLACSFSCLFPCLFFSLLTFELLRIIAHAQTLGLEVWINKLIFD